MYRPIATATLIAILVISISVTAQAADPTMNQIYDAAKGGHLDEAQRMIAKVLADHPNSAKAHYVQAELFAKAGKVSLARKELDTAARLNPGLSEFSAQSVQALKAQLGVQPGLYTKVVPEQSTITHSAQSLTTSRIPLARAGGTLIAPVIINDAIKLNFTVDSGAADVNIPADVFSTLVRAGTINRSDIKGSRRYVNANGESSEWETFIIRSLKVGDVVVENVEASVGSPKAPLLLGQSFLKRFKNWSVDNTTQELILQR
ncbi:MAG TPA: retroviral-like aspartic protease family protein [Steroidobacteraceae bacterium]